MELISSTMTKTLLKGFGPITYYFSFPKANQIDFLHTSLSFTVLFFKLHFSHSLKNNTSSNSPPLSSIFNFQYLAPVSNCTNNFFNSRPSHFSHFRTLVFICLPYKKSDQGSPFQEGSMPGLVTVMGSEVANAGFANDLLSDLGQVAQRLWAVLQ